jgi:predicted RNA binding protein YcfA (HicA-like mRNA interferase family)
MAKLPRNLDADDLLGFLQKNGFEIVRQKGSHIRLERLIEGEKFPITIPYHKPIKVGTLNNILNELVERFKVSKQELILAIQNKKRIIRKL